jgi:glycosyltransferase involved in cell wall biosynthesis
MKIALIYSFETSHWVSCQKIVSNLLHAYNSLTQKCDFYHLDYKAEDSAESWKSIKKLKQVNPDYIIFIDHKPHPFKFIEHLFKLGHKRNTSKFIFHIYGDFTLNLAKWERLFKILDQESIFFYAASERQKNMLTEFIDQKHLGVCPFPVHADEFNHLPTMRNQTRSTHDWHEDETVFLYTGRLSKQKNVHQLLTAFTKWRISSQAQARLVLVGEPDAIGKPFEDRSEWNGEYFQELLDLLAAFGEEDRARIEFHGFKSNMELPAYYNAADCFINLSLHHDEDYGMSCAEALATGLPLIISNWAGFASFKKPLIADSVKLIPVKLTDQGPMIDLDNISEELNAIHQTNKRMDRGHISKTSVGYFGIEASAGIIDKNFYSPIPFKQNKPLIQKTAYREQNFSNNTFYNHRERKYNELYLQIYKHYVQNS